MADMFYFRSPTRSLSPKCRFDLRHKLKVCKRRKSAKMDKQTQRACVARLEEPVFCPSGLTSLIPHYGFNECAQEDVSAVETATGVVQTPMNDGVAINSRNGMLSNTIYENSNMLPQEAQASLSSAAAYLDHPRPESHEISQEEDNRRTRFALEDPDESSSLIRRLLHLTAFSEEPSSHHEEDAYDSPTWLGSSAEPPSMYIPSTADDGSAIHVYDTDDDALAVDDPRRSYDFRDFMERWHDGNVGHDDETSPTNISSLLPESYDDVTQRDVVAGESDIQGLRWDRFGLRRDQALGSRKSHHPSNRICSSCHKKATMEESIDVSCSSETQYRFRNFTPQHRAQYSHYQLRNVLAAPSRADIFYAAGSKVMRTGLACPSTEYTVMDLSKTAPSHSPVRITCLSTATQPQFPSYRSDAVLLAGGFGGEYALLDLTAARGTGLHTGFVTHDYNGLVTHVDAHIARASGQLRACFCSNDRRLRLLDLKTQRFTHAFAYDHAVNCSALSPDGRLRVLVGDSRETLVTDAERGDVLVSMQEHRDHGFACAWAEDGRHVATGAQDGAVVLWDARNWAAPLRKMGCAMATPRSLHFTANGALIVGEDDDVVTVYDAKREDRKQEIRFFGAVAGVAVLDGGDEMVVANADKTVGGLLSFRRTPQLGSGERLPPGVEISREQRARQHRELCRDFERREALSDAFGNGIGVGLVV